MPDLPRDDAELIRRAQRGDEAALDELARSWRGYVAAICRYYLADAADADDAIQDTLVKLVVNVDRVDRRRPPGPYIGQIARRSCLDLIRKGAARRGGLHPVPPAGETGAQGSEPAAGACSDPVRPLIAAETRAVLRHCLDCLDPEKRLLLTLHYGHGIQQKDLAAHWPESLPFWRSKQTLSLWMKLAREALARCLKANGVDQESACVFLDSMREDP